MINRKRLCVLFASTAALAIAGIALFAGPQRNLPPFQLRWSGPGGGGESISGGAFSAAVTVGQPITGSAGGGAFEAGSGNWVINVPVRCGDLDGDRDVDLFDYTSFSRIITAGGPVVANADCNEDGDVDLDDFEAFTAAMTNPR